MRGAVALHSDWLVQDTLSDVAVFVVWSAQLGAQEKHVASATALVPDPRVTHYWDGAMLVGSAFQPLLGLPAPAWDTWMLFDRNAVWKDTGLPMPVWWEHQLQAGPPGLMLDSKRFASHAQALHLVNGTHR